MTDEQAALIAASAFVGSKGSIDEILPVAHKMLLILEELKWLPEFQAEGESL